MFDKLKTATLKNGSRILYDHVTRIEETHTQAGLRKIVLLQFTRGALGIVAVVPEERIESMEQT